MNNLIKIFKLIILINLLSSCQFLQDYKIPGTDDNYKKDSKSQKNNNKTLEIRISCGDGNLGEIVSSCLRAKHPGCGRCWKCFHKNGMLGHPYDINSREIQKFLNQRPVRTSTHALWWVNQQNHWDQLPDLLHLKEKDFSWWIQYYPPAFELLPEWIRSEIQTKIESMIEPIPQDSPFHSWNLFPDAP